MRSDDRRIGKDMIALLARLGFPGRSRRRRFTGRSDALGFPGRRPIGARRLLVLAAWLTLLVLIAVLTVWLMVDLAGKSWLMFDFRGDLYNAATAILHGHSPYRPGYLAHMAALEYRTGAPTPSFAVPVYPAPVLLASVPFGLLPLWLSGAAFALLSLAAMVWGLRLLGVRDWRCTAVLLLSWPALFGVWFGTLSPLMFLGVALAWRFRDQAACCAAAIAAVVLAKVFPGPLVLWPLLRRRWRTFGLLVLMTALALLVAGAIIGFQDLVAYPRLLANLTYVERRQGVSLATTLVSFGLAPGPARLAALGCAAALVLLAWRIARIPSRRANAFGILVVALLTASPLVWVHYEILLFVPIALLSPTFSAIWLLPLLSVAMPVPQFSSTWQMLIWPAIELTLMLQLCRRPAPGQAADRALAVPKRIRPVRGRLGPSNALSS